MAITSIASIQNNIDTANLLAVHNPLCFIVEVEYTSAAPDTLYASNDVTSDIYSCIPYSDPVPGKRQFIFIADEIVRGMMDDFDDEVQVDSTNEFQDKLTKEIEFRFYDPSVSSWTEGVNELYIDCYFCHASRQFGENPSLNEIYDNDTETYIGIVGFPCYVYYYCKDLTSTLSVTVI
jgi:hypothetical protein